MGFFSSLLTPSGPWINLASYPLCTGRKPRGEWNLIVQLHLLRRLRMCGIRPLHLHCRWKKLYLGLWIVFLTLEPDILVGVKLLHTVIVGGDGGVSSGAVTSNKFWVINLSYLECDALRNWYDYVKCHLIVAACRVSLVLRQDVKLR